LIQKSNKTMKPHDAKPACRQGRALRGKQKNKMGFLVLTLFLFEPRVGFAPLLTRSGMPSARGGQAFTRSANIFYFEPMAGIEPRTKLRFCGAGRRP